VSSVSFLRNPLPRGGFRFDLQCESGEHFLTNYPPDSEPLFQDCLSESVVLLLARLSEKCAAMDVEVSPEELRELGLFTTFVSSRVKPNSGAGVSCMSLWAEWVRFVLKQVNAFPNLIYEKEFRNLVVNQFECDIAEMENCGHVYSGIEFIPERNISIHITDSTFAKV
jgi:hypothetical protein